MPAEETERTRSGIVGVIVNPVAGKDIRRLSTGATHTPDTTKIGIVRRVVAGAAESGAARLLMADDPHRLALRATERLALPHGVDVGLLADHVTGTRLDTISAARALRDRGASVVVVLGGDGTCRDAATGWTGIPLIAISTGTNNVFPRALDGTSAGVAAGLLAAGTVPLERVAEPSKRIVIRVVGDRHGTIDDIALVDLALVDGAFVGARAVKDAANVRVVVAAIGEPASTGLSSIAGRVYPIDRNVRGGVVLTMADAAQPAVRRVRVPLSPGTFDALDIAEVRPIDDGEPIELGGPGVLAFDGERDLPIGPGTTVTATIERTGPLLVDVDRTIAVAAQQRRFDQPIAAAVGETRCDPDRPPGARDDAD